MRGPGKWSERARSGIGAGDRIMGLASKCNRHRGWLEAESASADRAPGASSGAGELGGVGEQTQCPLSRARGETRPDPPGEPRRAPLQTLPGGSANARFFENLI